MRSLRRMLPALVLVLSALALPAGASAAGTAAPCGGSNDINVTGLSGSVFKVTIYVWLNTDASGDTTLTLRSPSGRSVVLMDQRDVLGRLDLTFADAAYAPMDTTASGYYRPAEPLSAFAGDTGNGVWHLDVTRGSDPSTAVDEPSAVHWCQLNVSDSAPPQLASRYRTPNQGTFVLTWPAVEGASSYTLQRRNYLDDASPWVDVASGITDTSWSTPAGGEDEGSWVYRFVTDNGVTSDANDGVVVDRGRPTLTLDGVADGDVVAVGANIPVTLSCVDVGDAGMQDCQASDIGAPWSTDFQDGWLDTVAAGPHELYASGYDYAGNARSLPVIHYTVVADKPVNTALPKLAGGTAQPGSAVHAGDGTWTNSPTGFTYQWLRCDAAGANCDPVADGQTYTRSADDVGHRLRVAVTATNPVGSTEAISNASSVIGKPMVTAHPTISGMPEPYRTLTTSDGTWSNSPTGYTVVGWSRCDLEGAHCVAITTPDATDGDATYFTAPEDAYHTIRSRVKAANAAGSSTVLSLPSKPIGTAILTNQLSMRVAAENGVETLTARAGMWEGSDLTFTVEWLRCDHWGANCVSIRTDDATNAGEVPYTITPDDDHHTVRFKVTAANALGSVTVTGPRTPVIVL